MSRLVLRPFTVLLKICGFFVGNLKVGVGIGVGCHKRSRFMCFLWLIFQLGCIAVGAWFVAANCIVIIQCRQIFGLMSRMTISLIIQGLKPLHATVNLCVFLLNGKVHRQALQQFVDIDDRFRHVIRYRLINRYMIGHIILAVTVLFVGPLAIRISSIVITGNTGGWMGIISIIVVPMLSVWQMLPLYYFYISTKVLIMWFNVIYARFAKRLETIRQNNNDSAKCSDEDDQVRSDLSDLIDLYHKTAKGVFLLGTFFGPFIFFSIGISLAVLCVTIYYVTNTNEAIMLTAKELWLGDWFNTYMFMIWTGLQIVAAVAYLLVFCVCGWQINETARRISPLVLSCVPTSLELKFRIDQTINKVFTQFNWGMSIWRIMLIERSLLLTMTSGVVTYAMVLLKLQPPDCDCLNTRQNATN